MSLKKYRNIFFTAKLFEQNLGSPSHIIKLEVYAAHVFLLLAPIYFTHPHLKPHPTPQCWKLWSCDISGWELRGSFMIRWAMGWWDLGCLHEETLTTRVRRSRLFINLPWLQRWDGRGASSQCKNAVSGEAVEARIKSFNEQTKPVLAAYSQTIDVVSEVCNIFCTLPYFHSIWTPNSLYQSIQYHYPVTLHSCLRCEASSRWKVSTVTCPPSSTPFMQKSQPP